MVYQSKSATNLVVHVLPVVSSGISVVYQWKSAAKFGVITSDIPVFSTEISVV